jgi:hypothetical protein
MVRFGGTATLIVAAMFSRCSACGGNADPGQRLHLNGGRRSGWRPGSALSNTNGCLAWFTAVHDPYAIAAAGAAR